MLLGEPEQEARVANSLSGRPRREYCAEDRLLSAGKQMASKVDRRCDPV